MIREWLSEPIGNLIYYLLYSCGNYDRPLPMYGAAEGKRRKGLYLEAFDDFEKIAQQYPQELTPYLAMIDIAVEDMRDRDKAALVFHKAIATLDRREDCDTLSKAYKAVVSQLDRNPFEAHGQIKLKKAGPEYASGKPSIFR